MAAPDKAAVFREIRRLLRPHGRFVFTTWEAKTFAAGELPTTEQHRTFLQEAGFRTEGHEETAHWEELQREVYERWVQQQDELTREVGVRAAGMSINEALWLTTKLEDEMDRLSQSRRVFVVCRLDGTRRHITRRRSRPLNDSACSSWNLLRRFDTLRSWSSNGPKRSSDEETTHRVVPILEGIS